MTNSALPFDAKVAELLDEAYTARAGYDAWRALTSDIERPQYADVMNDYVGYFQIAFHSHFVAMLLALARLYDTHRDALSVPALARSAEGEPRISNELRNIVETRLAATMDTSARIRILRDKVFGHHDRRYTAERAFAEAQLTPDRCLALIEAALEVLLSLAAACSVPALRPDDSVREDCIAMLETLTRSAAGLQPRPAEQLVDRHVTSDPAAVRPVVPRHRKGGVP